MFSREAVKSLAVDTFAVVSVFYASLISCELDIPQSEAAREPKSILFAGELRSPAQEAFSTPCVHIQ